MQSKGRVTPGNIKLLLTLSIFIVIFFRKPELLYIPRFWAEEGSTFFAHAFNNGFISNMFSSHYGYYTLYNNLATSLAALFPLESAPLVTTWIALIVQASTSAMLIFGHYRLLPHLWQKAAVALSIQLLAYSGIWLNTIGVQYFLAVITFLILMYDENKRTATVQIFHGGVLIISGLTGVISCFMIPFFIYKFLITKAKTLISYAVILVVSLVIQLSIFMTALLENNPEVGSRLINNDAAKLIVKTISFQFATPFFGHLFLTTPAMEDAGFELRKAIFFLSGFDNFRSDSQVITFLFGSILLLIISILLFKKRKDPDVICIIGLLAIIIPLSTFLSVQMSGGPRYVYVPSIIIVFFLCSCLGGINKTNGVRSEIVIVLLGLSFFCNAYEYRRSISDTAYSNNWLPWKDEVRKWNQYERYELAIWPPPWRMNLNKSYNARSK